jgi:hypothetical protein
MKTAAIAATAIMALLVVGVATAVYAHPVPGLSAGPSNSSAASSAHSNNGRHLGQTKGGGNNRGENNRLNLTVGQTVTLSGLTGRYRSETNSSIRGNASGSLTLQVTGSFREGYVLSLKSGTISVAGVSYTITGGTVELGQSGQSASGSGTTSASGQFLIQVGIHGSSTTNPSARVVFDLKVGGSEYLVTLGTPSSGHSGSG